MRGRDARHARDAKRSGDCERLVRLGLQAGWRRADRAHPPHAAHAARRTAFQSTNAEGARRAAVRYRLYVRVVHALQRALQPTGAGGRVFLVPPSRTCTRRNRLGLVAESRVMPSPLTNLIKRPPGRLPDGATGSLSEPNQQGPMKRLGGTNSGRCSWFGFWHHARPHGGRSGADSVRDAQVGHPDERLPHLRGAARRLQSQHERHHRWLFRCAAKSSMGGLWRGLSTR